MRDVRKQLVPRNRFTRRMALMALIAAASPAIGSETNAHVNAFSPLPLQAGDGRSAPRTNPFCEPMQTTPSGMKAATGKVSGNVTLASGGEASVVRLVPIGNAIGLSPIDQPRLAREGRAAMTIELPPAAGIQTNPLIQSQHHPIGDDNGLVAAPLPVIAPETVTRSENAFVHQAKRSVASEFAGALRGGPVSGGVSIQSMSSIVEIDAEAETVIEAETQIVTDIPIELVSEDRYESEPIFFSFSDNDDSPSVGSDVDEDAERDVIVHEHDDEYELPADEPVAMVEPLTIMDFAAQASEAIAVPKRRSPVVQSAPGPAEMSPQKALSAKRHRPPVAVTSVPIAFDRQPESAGMNGRLKSVVGAVVEVSEVESFADALDEATAETRTPVTAPFANSLSPNSLSPDSLSPNSSTNSPAIAQAMASSNLTPLYMSRAQVRSLTFGGKVTDVEVGDKSICQAFAAGPNQLKLIGTGDGVTRLVVWAVPDRKPTTDETSSSQDGVDESEASQPVMRAFEIHVTESVDAIGDDSVDHTVMLNQSIRQAFPEADVVVHQRDNRLIVSGRCGSDATATKILRMVRKTCLIPVQDELVVR